MRRFISHALLALICLLGLGIAVYALFVLSDPIDAFKNTGPFSGRVIDAETKQPIKGAFVLAGWAGYFFHGGCVGGTITRTDADGRFYIPWQGMNIMWLSHTSVTVGRLSIWAVDYRTWDIGEDTPRIDAQGTKAALPVGIPFVAKDVGTVMLTRKYWEDYGIEESRRSLNCATADWFNETQEYLAYRSKWTRVCAQSDALESASSADFENLAKRMMHLPFVRPKEGDTSRHYGRGNQPVDPELVAAYNARQSNFDQMGYLIYAPQVGLRLKTVEELTKGDRRKACELLDVSVAGMQE